MKTVEAHGRHLSPDEIVSRVFPAEEGPAPVPMHLAVCVECQSKVARLREGWLLDRGAMAGVVDALPEVFWQAQTASVMASVREAQGSLGSVRSFSLQRSIVRRPILAFGSLAAALVLVAGLSILKTKPAQGPIAGPAGPIAVPTRVVPLSDQNDDELLRDVDRVLAEESPYSTLVPEGIS